MSEKERKRGKGKIEKKQFVFIIANDISYIRSYDRKYDLIVEIHDSKVPRIPKDM